MNERDKERERERQRERKKSNLVAGFRIIQRKKPRKWTFQKQTFLFGKKTFMMKFFFTKDTIEKKSSYLLFKECDRVFANTMVEKIDCLAC